jgi:hypothetical protein
MTATPRTLTEMQNRPTAYEIAVSVNGKSEVIAFAQKTTERALRATITANMNDEREAFITAAMTAEELNADYAYNRELGRIYFAKNVWIGKTGRTERDAAAC